MISPPKKKLTLSTQLRLILDYGKSMYINDKTTRSSDVQFLKGLDHALMKRNLRT